MARTALRTLVALPLLIAIGCRSKPAEPEGVRIIIRAGEDACVVLVGKREVGKLCMPEKESSMAGSNARICDLAAVRAKELCAGPDRTVFIDADAEVPYEYVVGIVNACVKHGLSQVEFGGNPRPGEGNSP